MPLTRSQEKVVDLNTDPESNPGEIVVLIETDKCKGCKNRFEKWFELESFSFQRKCPCILSLCKECCDESFHEDEYCPFDKHTSPEHYFELLGSERGEEILPGDVSNGTVKIFFQLDDLKIPGYYEDSSDCADGEAGQIPGIGSPTVATNGFSYPSCTENPVTKKQYNHYLIAAFVLMVALYSYQNSFPFGENQEVIPLNKESNIDLKMKDITEKIKKLKDTFPKQPQDLWGSLRVGMRNLVKKMNSPTTILLLHGENYTVDSCILESVKKIVLNDIVLFHQKEEASDLTKKPKGVVIDMESYKEVISNHGEFMEMYRTELEQDKILIVKNFQKSTPTVIQAFHYLSDTIDPWVKNLLIIVTLKIKETNPNKKAIVVAENELRELLKSLPENLSEPIVTRLTDHVYMVVDEGSSLFRVCPL